MVPRHSGKSVMRSRFVIWSPLLFTILSSAACSPSSGAAGQGVGSRHAGTGGAANASDQDASVGTPATADGAAGFTGLGSIPPVCVTNCADASNPCGDAVL